MPLESIAWEFYKDDSILNGTECAASWEDVSPADKLYYRIKATILMELTNE